MNGNNLLVDTNILIYLLEGDEHVKEIVSEFNLYASFITEIEIRSKKHITVEEKRAINALLEGINIIDLSDELKSLTITNRTEFGLKIPDSFILATAQWLQLPLLTSDKAFEKAKESTAEIIIF